MKHVHLVGVSGTGMGALATLLKEDGHRVTGSDVAFDPPIGPALEAAGVECLRGWDAAHLSPRPDLVVVGNAIRKDNPEARFVEAEGLARSSMSAALRELFLAGRTPLVVCGTHGKTTTSAMCAHVLAEAQLEPGWFIGGLPKNLPAGAAVGSRKRRLVNAAGRDAAATPFVVEGDEYDAVYWHKAPKFLDYVGVSERDVVIVTSVEHDHIDIYADAASYEAAFRELVRRIPPKGLLVVDASAHAAMRIAAEARCEVVSYALDGDDTAGVTPTWTASLAPVEGGALPFDLYGAGTYAGRTVLGVPGAHNARNALACLAATTQGFGVDLQVARTSLGSFRGVARRQDLLGTPGGVFVYDDFAHHPTAVRETLAALRSKHAGKRLLAVFEPRSATACRALHQAEYVPAFDGADKVILAPLGRTNVPEAERLDLTRLAKEIGARAHLAASVDDIVAELAADAASGDVVVIMSNGSFAGLHGRVLSALGDKVRS